MSAIESAVSKLAREWQQEVERRRQMSPNDVTADILHHCATGLLTALATASEADEELSPAEYGAQSHVNKSASQVRRWCQAGAIECRRVGRDYRIRRGATPPSLSAVA
jgi:predicted RNA-binding Zn ribbon-like protein